MAHTHQISVRGEFHTVNHLDLDSLDFVTNFVWGRGLRKMSPPDQFFQVMVTVLAL